jgi:hypothetical protein
MPYKDISQQKAYAKKHYIENKKDYLECNKRRRKELKEYIKRLKENTPCTDCGVNYHHYVMDFDHLESKEGLIKVFVSNNNRTGLEKELKKCEIVCSNCHRERTQRRILATTK